MPRARGRATTKGRQLRPQHFCAVTGHDPSLLGPSDPCNKRLGSLGERQGEKGTWGAYTDPQGWEWYRCPVHGPVAIRDGRRYYPPVPG